jgi:hypothetical protein
MMGKMSSKFTQLQKGVSGTPSAANPNAKPADWKKWAKRGAIGVAGIGAIALGVDAAGDMFSGAEGLMGGGDFSGGADFSGGGDFSGGADFSGGGDFTGGEDFSGGGFEDTGAMDAQTAVDASAVQADLAMTGQENAMMLADPPGTTCEFHPLIFWLEVFFGTVFRISLRAVFSPLLMWPHSLTI